MGFFVRGLIRYDARMLDTQYPLCIYIYEYDKSITHFGGGTCYECEYMGPGVDDAFCQEGYWL